MQTPNPLPQPGAWLVMPDGIVYEVVEPTCYVTNCPDQGTEHAADAHPAWHGSLAADDRGVTYLSVDSGESIWTPWADVYAVGTYSEVDAIAAALDRDDVREAFAPRAAEPETVARYVVTIRHRQGGDPYTPAMLRAVADVMAAALSAAGIPATATAEPLP